MTHSVLKVFSLALSLTAVGAPGASADGASYKGFEYQSNVRFAPASDVGLFSDGARFNLRVIKASSNTRVGKVAALDRSGGRISRLKSLIALAEAGPHGYDAVQYSATRKPGARPTEMTLAEIFTWIKRTPGQNHAIGRYQFIPATLRDLVRRGGIPISARFTPQLQDRLADILLQDAGLHAFQSGRISRTRFMNNLSLIWAGLPTSSGKSAYHGYAGNRATISWATYNQEMAAIFR
ncbi:hypothetical protein [Thalassovita taeanensis]|uniref:Uncharacterized protein n=1 Tax=Thalassovita taeanensis TaxID=657014 RepID=A0A1H9ED99_9RHOB|nr:hypothetical protein [Thalassovita taeanensis]SEQ23726.1 hypothetical protein SAMN04488092_10510 [Thalassovita taeanensis]